MSASAAGSECESVSNSMDIAVGSAWSDSGFEDANSSSGSATSFSDTFVRYTTSNGVVTNIAIKKQVTFKRNSGIISAAGKKVVAAVAKALTDHPATCVTVEGHTFSKWLHRDEFSKIAYKKGSAKYLDLMRRMSTLSLKRAQNVKLELVKKGVKQDKVRAVGMGDARPLKQPNGKYAQEKSRRVVFRTNANTRGRYDNKGRVDAKKGKAKGSAKRSKKDTTKKVVNPSVTTRSKKKGGKATAGATSKPKGKTGGVRAGKRKTGTKAKKGSTKATTASVMSALRKGIHRSSSTSSQSGSSSANAAGASSNTPAQSASTTSA